MQLPANSATREAGDGVAVFRRHIAPPLDWRLLHHLFAHGVSDAEIAAQFRLSGERVAGLRAYYGMADRATAGRRG